MNQFQMDFMESLTVLEAITSVFNVANAVTVLTVIAAGCVGLAFMWWGLRKAISALMSAFRKGKVSL